jgi:hypothetical protein
MFQDLDNTLAAVADDPAAPPAVRNAEVSFETPDRNYAPTTTALNLFLHQARENRDLRDPEPLVVFRGGHFLNRPPPIRIDCSYLVTAWSDKTGAQKIADEHQMLGHALAWLNRFGTIPDHYLQGALIGQPFPPPTMVAQMDGSQYSHEFWSALGIAPRLSFTLMVTIAMELDAEYPLGPEVVTRELRLGVRDGSGVLERTFGIAGLVRDADSNALIADVEVTIDELQRTTQTDTLGRYQFHDLDPGNYTLVAAADGFQAANVTIEVPGATPNAYSIELSAA